MKTLRIIFTLICALSLALLPLIGIFFVEWIALPIIIAGVSFLLMLHFKAKQEQQEALSKQTPTGDYFTPLSSSSEANEQNDSVAESTESAPSHIETKQKE